MARFVSDERVPVYLDEDPTNIIYIRPKMNVGIQNRVMGAVASLKAGGNGQDVAFNIGAYNTAFLTNNIVGWAGPDFDNVECSPENIERLDPDDLLLDKVLGEINRRNTKKDAPDPKLSGSNGHSDLTKKKERTLQVIASASGTTT
jgi:hypothetical protein